MTGARGLAIFDLDGTLVDSRQDLADAGNAMRAQLGLPPLPLAEVVSYVGDGVERLVERLLPSHGPVAMQRGLALFRTAYDACCTRHTAPYPGIPAALARLRDAGWALGVATNKGLAFSERILVHCGLREAFAAVRGGDRFRKPDPGALLEIRAAVAHDPAHAWMIGDHHTDIRAGQAAQLRVAWAGWGFGHADGLTADALLARPEDVPAVLLAGM